MNTGEDVQGLRKIIDFTRLLSIFILAIHFYIACYQAFAAWEWTAGITDSIIDNIARTGLFEGLFRAKLAALLLLVVSLVGVKGRKDEKILLKPILVYLSFGAGLYFASTLFFLLPSLFLGSKTLIAVAYIGLTSIGYLLILTGGGQLSRLLKDRFGGDIFNEENETFPQEERLLENEYSINLPARYRLGKAFRESWINVLNPFRGLLVAGTPGAGKSYFVIRHIIDQHIRKGFSIFIYDFKFDDLSKIAYNKLLKYAGNYKVKPKFFVINFDDLNRTHRCNPLDPQAMDDITDATEASRTIMMGLNRDWIKKQGDFFVESPINFLTACIWYLRKYEDGRYCTLPHVIELMQSDYESLFAVLKTQEEIKVLINPFISAYHNNAMAQLEGQIASAKIGLARLSSPQLYYVLSGNDFTLDVNSPDEPKIVCVGNNPQKLQVYGAVLSLYISRMIKLVNRKGQLKSSLIFDEFPTIYFNNMDSLIATARSNKVATCLAVQDFSQLKKDYGSEQADVITGIVGNIISGQLTGSTAKTLSENFGKISQAKDSMSINSSDTSITKATQMDYAIPASKIATLSSGEFVGVVADNPEQKIKLKMFHCEIQMYVGENGNGDRERWYRYTHPDDPDGSGEGMLESVSNDMSFFMEKQGYNFRNSIKQWMAEVLEVLYAAAALCINVVRTFILIVLTILGPLVFGFAVFDGFQQSLTVWIARYVNIFMWLPIANILGSILGKIQENMLKLDISQIGQEGETFFSSSDVAYLIFMVIGIVAYFCVPTVANYIVHAGGGNTILQKTNMIMSSSSKMASSAGSAGMGMAADALGNGPRMMSQGYAGASQGDYFPDGKPGGGSHQHDKLSGK